MTYAMQCDFTLHTRLLAEKMLVPTSARVLLSSFVSYDYYSVPLLSVKYSPSTLPGRHFDLYF